MSTNYLQPESLVLSDDPEETGYKIVTQYGYILVSIKIQDDRILIYGFEFKDDDKMIEKFLVEKTGIEKIIWEENERTFGREIQD